MKRKPILFALALLLVVGAALWGVNTRLDHPPLTKADKEFRALVAGADSVKIQSMRTQSFSSKGRIDLVGSKRLNAAQTRELIETFRFISRDGNGGTFFPFSPGQRQINSIDIQLTFLRANKPLALLNLSQSPKFITLGDSKRGRYYRLNPRFNKSLVQYLDAYLPQRIRP